MHITTILGSPRLKGNTASILSKFEELAKSKHNIDRINMAQKNIHGCIGCWKCQKEKNFPGCVFSDEGTEILNSFLKTDMIVYASPVYVWGFTSQIKPLLDRQCSLYKYDFSPPVALLKNKPVLLLTTCGGDNASNSDLIAAIFKREMTYLQCNILGIFSVENCSTPDELKERDFQTAFDMMDTVNSVFN